MILYDQTDYLFWRKVSHDYFNLEDFPESWLKLDITIEVEVKAKELAALKLMREIEKKQEKFRSGRGI